MTRTIATVIEEMRRIARQSRQAWRFLKGPQKAALAFAMVLMAGIAYFTTLIPLTLGFLVDAILREEIVAMEGAAPYLWALAIAYVAQQALQVVRKIAVEGAASRVERDATDGAVARMLRSDIAHVRALPAGALNGKITRSVSGLVKLLKLAFLDMLPAIIGASFALGAAFYKSPLMGAVMAGVIPVALLIVVIQLASQRGVRVSLLAAREQLDGTVVEQIGGIETVRASDTTDFEISRVRAITDDLRKKSFKHHVFMAGFDAMKSLNEGGFHVLVIAMALALALAGVATPGDVLAFSILFVAIMNPLRDVHRILDEAHECSIRTEGFFEILGWREDISFHVANPAAPEASYGVAIEAEDLWLMHGDMPVVRGMTIRIRRGETVGFAGVSGSGKTSFIHAVTRLLHPAGGKLVVGGVSIQDLSREPLAKLVGMVGQTPFLFTGTIRENIAYGNPGASRESIRAAARQAQILDEIEALPEGLDRRLGERGAGLSGGQKQRIALARIFLSNPPILILDEATAALDNENERAVMRAITALARGRTVLMIAHRLSSLANTDRIIVMKDGRIVEEGSYQELAAKAGAFNELLHGSPARKGLTNAA
jgi:ATP-binding cassette subfamily B protein